MQNSYLDESGFFFPQFYSGCVIGEELFFSPQYLNGIYSLNLYTGKIGFKNFFEGEGYLTKALFSTSTVFENKVFYVPDMGKTIQYYDLMNGETKRIKNEYGDKFFRDNYTRIVPNGIYLYCFPVSGTKILKVNMKEEKIEKIYDIEKEYFETFGKHLKVFTDSGLYVFDKMIYGAFIKEPIIFKFDMESETIRFMMLPELQEGFIQMDGEGDKLALLNLEKKMLIFSIYDEKVNECIPMQPEIEPIKFRAHYKEGDDICFCSGEDEHIFRINVNTQKYKLNTIDEECKINKEDGEWYRNVPDGNGKYAIFVSNKGNIVSKNLMNGQVRCVKMIYKPDPAIISKYKSAGGIHVAEDNDLMCINNLIKYCEGNGHAMKSQSIGKEIFKKICE